MPAGYGVSPSEMTNRQLVIAVPFVLVIAVGNICLFAYAFVLEWSHLRRFSELVGLALIILFFLVFLVWMEVGFLSELLKRRRVKRGRIAKDL